MQKLQKDTLNKYWDCNIITNAICIDSSNIDSVIYNNTEALNMRLAYNYRKIRRKIFDKKLKEKRVSILNELSEVKSRNNYIASLPKHERGRYIVSRPIINESQTYAIINSEYRQNWEFDPQYSVMLLLKNNNNKWQVVTKLKEFGYLR